MLRNYECGVDIKRDKSSRLAHFSVNHGSSRKTCEIDFSNVQGSRIRYRPSAHISTLLLSCRSSYCCCFMSLKWKFIERTWMPEGRRMVDGFFHIDYSIQVALTGKIVWTLRLLLHRCLVSRSKSMTNATADRSHITSNISQQWGIYDANWITTHTALLTFQCGGKKDWSFGRVMSRQPTLPWRWWRTIINVLRILSMS